MILSFLLAGLLLLGIVFAPCYLLARVFTKVRRRRVYVSGIIMALVWLGLYLAMTQWESAIMRFFGFYGEMHMFVGYLFIFASYPVAFGGLGCLILLLMDRVKWEGEK